MAAWALNQLVRADAAAVEELFEAGAALRAAHGKALGGDASELRAATRREQDTVATLARRAAEVIEQAGGSGQAQFERLTETLRVASTDATAGGQLRAGRLTSDLEAAGLDWADAGLAPPDREPQGPTTVITGDARAPADNRTSADEEAETARQAAAQRLARAQRKAERARRAADEAAERAERLADEADRAEAVAKAARLRADDAGAEAERLAAEAAEAEQAAQPMR